MKRASLPILLSFLLWGTSAWGVTPMDYYNSLVAGGDDEGYKDGSFVSARFDHPMGLAMNEKGTELYVADPANHRVRVVHLDHDNQVDTLAGTGELGAVDAGLDKATFIFPQKLSYVPGRGLVVFDGGGQAIRWIDLTSKKVSTLAKGLNIWDMVYQPKDDSVYFSEPDNKKVEKLDLKTDQITSVLANNPQVVMPGALCLYQGNVCVADSFPNTINPSTIYEMVPSPRDGTISLLGLGTVRDVLGLTSTDGNLYALQGGGTLWRIGVPESTELKYPTAWGFLFRNQDHQGKLPFLKLDNSGTVGFIASTSEDRKFYVSMNNSIVSVRDYDFEKWLSVFSHNDQGLTDFDYPQAKPPHTFRILAMGSSRNSTAVPIPADPQAPVNEDVEDGDPKFNGFSKKLEFLLNAEASLNDSPTHFEVINYTRRGDSLSVFADEIPKMVKKYDIDLVIALTDRSGYRDYYEKNLNAQGVPYNSTGEKNRNLPLSQRAPAGAAADILARCKAINFPVSEKQECPGDGLWDLYNTNDPHIQEDLYELAGRRLAILDQQLSGMKMADGNTPRLVLWFAPSRMFPEHYFEAFWSGVCDRFHLNFIDLTEPYDALKLSYYPADARHYTVYGNELISRLLFFYLVKDKMVPMP